MLLRRINCRFITIIIIIIATDSDALYSWWFVDVSRCTFLIAESKKN